MKLIRYCTFYFFLLLVGFQSFAAEVSKVPNPPTSTITPLFWQLEYKGVKSYALGSVHLGIPSMYPLPKPIMAGYKAADFLAVEVDIGEESQSLMAELVEQFGKDKKRNITSWLSEPTQKLYSNYCTKQSIPCHRFTRFKPWLVSVTFTSRNFMRSGYDPKLGIDQFFLQQANNKKPVIELETIESQFELFANLSQSLQEEMLLQSMSEQTEDLTHLVDLWMKGDEDGLIKVFSEVENEQLEKVFIEQILIKRNYGMAEGLLSMLKSSKSVFVVIGTAHLIGQENILDLLKKGGVKVTKVDL